MRMQRWTRDRNMLMTVVIFLVLCSSSRHVAAETELEVLEEVNDALNHADRSLEDLSDLVDEVITDTTTTKFSTSTTTTDAITTPKTTTTTSPTTTTTAASTASPVSTLSPTTITPPITTTVVTPPTTTTETIPPTTTTVTTPPTITTGTTPPTTTTVTTPPTISSGTTPPTTTTVTTPPTITSGTTPPTTTTVTTPPTTTTVTTPPTTINVTTSSTTTATTTTPTTTTSATTTDTPSLSSSTSTAEDNDRSLADFSKDFPSMLRLVKIWNSDQLLHARAVQGTHGPSSGDVSPLTILIDRATQSTDSEHYKKQKSASRVDPLTMGVLTERLNELMNEPSYAAWATRVNECLRVMENVIAEITGGSVDMTHAQQLEEEATIMDELVEEGRNDTSLVVEGELDFGLLESVQENVNNASHIVDVMISDEKADNTEMVVTIVMLSLLFVVVLTGLIVAFVRPWAKRSGLKSSRSKWMADNAVAKDVRTFPDARFMQHSHVYTDPYRSHDTKV